MKKLIIIAAAVTLLTSCAKEEAVEPLTENSLVTEQIVIREDVTVKIEVMGGSQFNDIHYSSNGTFVSSYTGRYEYTLSDGEFISVNASFYQLYSTSGGGAMYPWIYLNVYLDGVLYETEGNGNLSVAYTYTNK